MTYLRKTKEISFRARTNILKIVHSAKGGHVGGSLSVVDILASCYAQAEDIPFELILSKGHCILAWVCVLHEIGMISQDMLDSYYTNGSTFGGHPKKGTVPEITWGTGSLGHGLSVSCGKALANPNKRYICILGDGETNEGSIWEGLMFLSQHQISNVTTIIDNNAQESLDLTDNILSIENIEHRLSGFNLSVKRIDGHNIADLVDSVNDALKGMTGPPKVIIADTIKGKGVSFMERDPKWHHRKLTDQELNIALAELSNNYL